MGAMDGKVAFVTGAARGQGRSHAVRLAQEGADLVLSDTLTPVTWTAYPAPAKEDLAETAALVEREGRRVVFRHVDVRDGDGLRLLVGDAVTRLGSIDAVIANAGIAPPQHRFWEIPEQEWQDMLDVNLTGVWRTVSAAVPAMIDGGRGGAVVLISSGAAYRGASNIAAYVAAKAGVLGLTVNFARELARYRIRVNAICPSNVGTPMLRNDANYKMFRPDLGQPTEEDAIPAFTRWHLLAEPWLEPEDISEAVLFLASDRGRFVTGITMPVDLGGSLK